MKRIVLIFVVLIGISVIPAAAGEETQEFSLIAERYTFIPETLVVKKGVPVTIHATSTDVDHGISIFEFRVSSGKIEKGKITTFTFTPDKTGEFTIDCDVMCGSGHRNMKSKLVVVE